MSAFDATVRVGNVDIQPIQDEDGGLYDAHMVLGVTFLMQVGPDQAMSVPLGALRVPLNKESIGHLISELQGVYDKLEDRPKPSALAVASTMQGVEELAGTLDKIR